MQRIINRPLIGLKVFYGGLTVLLALPVLGFNGVMIFGAIIMIIGYILILLNR